MGTQEYLLDRAKKEGKLEERAITKKLIAEERAKAEKEKVESAKKMLQSGIDVQLISDILGLSVVEIEKLM